MQFVINETPKIKIKAGEIEYEMSQPTMGSQHKLQEQLNECQANGKSPFPVLIDWAASLGLPREFIESLPQRTFQELIEYVSDTKKK